MFQSAQNCKVFRIPLLVSLQIIESMSVKHFGHSFVFDAPKIWNELPHDMRSATSVASFRKKLKTYLFAKVYAP